MCEAVEQGCRHFSVAEHAGPFTEGEVRGDDDGGAFVEPADEVEQELCAGLGEGQIPCPARCPPVGMSVVSFPLLLWYK
jgi:hypothetical protein